MSWLFPLSALLPLLVFGGEPPLATIMHDHATLESTLRGVADKNIGNQLLVQSQSQNQTYPRLLNFTDPTSGVQLASMVLGDRVSVDLANTKCQGVVVDGKCCSGKGEGKCDTPGRIVADKATMINIPLVGSVTPSASSTGNETLTLIINFADIATNTSGLTLNSVAIKLIVATKGVIRPDYWNLTSASLALDGTLNGTALPASSDITPRVGYSRTEPACTAPYSICAPSGLSWTCDDQILAPTSSVVNNITLGSKTVMVHILGMVLQLGSSPAEQYNWDCDPLIPISVWVSVLISLFLASILMWGICMLATLQTPTKFDDPKGPSIHVDTKE